MRAWRVTFENGCTTERITVWARSHEEAYREALRVARVEGQQPDARIEEQP